MKGLKKKSVDILCAIGKFGVGKSLTLGMYDFEIPMELKEASDVESVKMQSTKKNENVY